MTVYRADADKEDAPHGQNAGAAPDGNGITVAATPSPDPMATIVSTMSRVCSELAAGNRANLDILFELTAPPDENCTDTKQHEQLAELAEAFGMMIVQLEVRELTLNQTMDELRESKRQLEYARDQLSAENRSLRQTVRKLNVEIDQARKDSEVSEIADTDYFRALQQKARRIRDRNETVGLDFDSTRETG